MSTMLEEHRAFVFRVEHLNTLNLALAWQAPKLWWTMFENKIIFIRWTTSGCSFSIWSIQRFCFRCATIAHWIRLCPPFCCPGFESQAHYQRFYQFIFYLCHVEKTNLNKKRPVLFNDLLTFWWFWTDGSGNFIFIAPWFRESGTVFGSIFGRPVRWTEPV